VLEGNRLNIKTQLIKEAPETTQELWRRRMSLVED